jgi:single-strand DNA-binding protein
MGFIATDINGDDMKLKDGSTMRKARFSIACNRKSKNAGADFVQVTALGKTAETLEKWLSKGKGIYVDCHCNTGKYQNKEGKTVYTQDFIVDSFEFPPVRKDEQNAVADTHTEEVSQSNEDIVPDDIDLDSLPFR